MSKQFISALVLSGVSTLAWCQAGAAAKPAAPPLEDGAAFMQRVRAKLSASSTISGTLEVKDTAVHEVPFKAMRPNFISATNPDFEMHGNGTALMIYSPKAKVYTTVPVQMASKAYFMLLGFEGVMGSDAPYSVSGKAKPTMFRGAKATAVSLSNSGMGGSITLYVDPDSLQPIAFASGDGKNTAVYKDIVLGSAMKAEDFAWVPPADAKSEEQIMKEAAAKVEQKNASSEPPSRLLKEGAAAPDFTLKTPTGGTLTLSKSLGKKATIVNFWADFCGPCHAEMPVFVKLYKQLKAQGLEIISIDDGDEANVILKDVKENGLNYLHAMNGKDKLNMLDLYGVDAFPTNYILDANGKIIGTIVGYDEEALRDALKKAGFDLK